MKRLIRVACCALSVFPAIALGQAWVPEKGEGTTSTTFEYLATRGHFDGNGNRTPEAAANLRSVLFDVEYGVTDRLALTVTVPIVTTRYASTNPPSDELLVLFKQAIQSVNNGFYNHQFLDDGQSHTTLQDFRFNARYKLLSRPVVVTPFVGSAVPSHDYAYVGEAAPGRNLKEFQFGADVARRLNPFLRKAYVDGQWSFAIPEAALSVRTNRTNVALEMGYLLNRKLAARGFGHWQHTFKGLQFPDDLTTPELELTHEQLLKANYWHLGGGFSYGITRDLEVAADAFTYLSGSNTHYGSGVAVRISHSFTLKTPTSHHVRSSLVDDDKLD
jgi:hypothetical protein